MIIQGFSALADTAQCEFQQVCQREDSEHHSLERKWRDEDIQHRNLEKQWRKIENKRRRVEEKTAQVALLARLSALMGGFQVAVFINQSVPSLSETWPSGTNSTSSDNPTVWTDSPILNGAVMCLWSVSAVGVITVNFSIMVPLPSPARPWVTAAENER